jgi:hypothetical protein
MILSRMTAIGTAAALAAGIAAFAPASVQAQETPTPAAAPAVGETRANQRTGAATLTGCLVRESEFRKAHNLGGGTAIAVGMGDEFVLADARDTAPGSTAAGTCSESTFTGTAYRITGSQEDKMKTLVGRRIEVTGFFEPDRDAESKLPEEVDVRTYREFTATAEVTSAPAPVAQAEAREAVVADARPEPAPMAAEPAREALPSTASPLPLIGLMGLFSLAGSGLLLRRKR